LAENSFNKKHILLADDNPINREMVKIILENFNFIVTAAENGIEVLNILDKSLDFDLIILDINMPKLNGIQTALKIRNSNITKLKNIPIIALTGNETNSEINSIYNAGIKSYIAKPASPDELLKVIKKSIQNPDYSNKIINDSPQEQLFDQPNFSNLNNQDEIDIQKGIFYVGNDFNIFKKLLLRFYKNYTGYIEKIKAFAEKNEHKNLKFAIHNLKGVSAQICADNLNKETKKIEDILKTEPLQIDKNLIKNLETHFNKTMAAIETLLSAELNSIDEIQSFQNQELSPQILKKNLLLLASALKQKEIIKTESLLKDISRSSLNPPHREILNEIKIFAKNFDFESALLRVKNFLKLL
jgi:CheY-like chemotaxis protein